MHIYVWPGQAVQLQFLSLAEDRRLQMVHTQQQSETAVFHLSIRDLITTLAETLRKGTTYDGF